MIGAMMYKSARCAVLIFVVLLGVFQSRANGVGPLDGSPFAGVLQSGSVAGGSDGAPASNRVELLSSGYNALLLRVHLIRRATKSIEMQTFIWTNDEVGRLLIYELIEAARRGVKVRIIADHMFSDQDPDVVAFLAAVHPNIEVRHYRPATSRMRPGFLRTALAGLASFHDVNQRMHSKVMVVDGAVLITGGRNVENTYFDHSTGLNFRDRDVLVIGPVVKTATDEFEQFWRFRYTVKSRDLIDVKEALKSGTFKRFDRREDYRFGPYFTAMDKEANDNELIATRFASRLRPVREARFLYDAPGKSRQASSATARITRELSAALKEAKSSVVLQTPYLVLSSSARNLLLELRRRTPAVAVRVSTNSFASTDNLFAYSANYRLRNDYVETLGLSIFELKPHPGELLSVFPTYPEISDVAERNRRATGTNEKPFLSLHAKSLVIDNIIGFVGSYNLDPRSENLNTEVGLLVIDPEFAQTLRAEIENDMLPENSWVIARRNFPLGLDVVNGLVGGILSLSPVDVWPIQNTSSFELLPNTGAVPPEDPSFHQHYREVGAFPGADGNLSQKEILTRLFKAVGSPLTPIL